MPMPPDSLDDLTLQLRRFAAERDWETFHSPKNLAMALTGEAGELAAEFQWLTEAESLALQSRREARVQGEACGARRSPERQADRAGFDLLEAARDKIALNALKYPAERVRGSARKYTDYNDPSACR